MRVHRASAALLALFLFAPASFAASPSPAPSGAAKAPAPSGAANKAEVLWDSWYTVTAAGKTPYGYYNDRFERKGDKIAFKNQMWRREEGHINEEQVVAIAADDANLTPEFWNFHSTLRSSTLDVDGSFKGNILTAKVRQDSKPLAPITHSIAKQTHLSVMFPVWLSKKLPDAKPGRGISVSVLFEDGLQTRFMAQSGSARLEAPDAFAKESGTRKVAVNIDGKQSHWWVRDNGEPVRIDMITHNIRVEKVTEAVARRFLMDSPPAPSVPVSPAPMPTKK